MSGYEQAKAKADKLKEENKEAEEKAVAKKEETKNYLAKVQNEELAGLYRQNAKMGAENLGGNAPYLRIHTANSTANELPGGKYPKDGNLFYNPTKEEYSEVLCHILTISRGFKVWQEDKKTGAKKLQFNQLIGGMITNDGEYKPFLMYVNGLKLQPMWKFGKEASEFTGTGIPMFSLTVKITTEQVKSDYGMKWVPKFEIVREDNAPVLVLDLETFKMLQGGVVKLQESIEKLIQAKSSDEENAPVNGEAQYRPEE